MTKISQYSTLSNPTEEDILIGTDKNNSDETKNFSIGSIVNLVENGGRPYKSYTALLTQEEEDDPVATVLENTIGDIVWTRRGEGDYIGTLSNAFTINKTWFSKPSLDYWAQSNNEENVWASRLNTDTVNLYNVGTDTLPIDGIGQLSIEIRVYN